MATRIQLAALLVSLALVGGGVLGFGFVADEDYSYRYEGQLSETPETVPPLYSELSQSEQRAVDRALAGEVLRFEDDPGNLPGLVERDGNYYAFEFDATTDYTAPTTVGSLVAVLLGAVGVVATVRWEVASRYVTY
ncbi:hypothetical protein C5B91_13395 [Haloferax sp. Atlit-10N]|uniref:hypothetical protein n=1 Tax=unclassified Haloferax TaxID=2625095 RepID=UPI000E2729B0|nr:MULTISPECIES: hypothetical protein [unclassified Haloferax]RDZ42886.1 hypothetical protein C5B86_14450 [Haloferax sp. Atlit-19N]RDZ43121.1 hypothetical protein C5B87_14225 [Haloferax sp. Atlit-16N]RDZ57695.1 hypothetical protein C5B91_13395 [Haloferax sp. Atlit-10N]